MPTWTSNLDLFDAWPPIARALDYVSSYARLIVMDRRGSGLSDRSAGIATLEEGMDDVLAVIDDVGGIAVHIGARVAEKAGPANSSFPARCRLSSPAPASSSRRCPRPT